MSAMISLIPISIEDPNRMQEQVSEIDVTSLQSRHPSMIPKEEQCRLAEHLLRRR